MAYTLQTLEEGEREVVAGLRQVRAAFEDRELLGPLLEALDDSLYARVSRCREEIKPKAGESSAATLAREETQLALVANHMTLMIRLNASVLRVLGLRNALNGVESVREDQQVKLAMRALDSSFVTFAGAVTGAIGEGKSLPDEKVAPLLDGLKGLKDKLDTASEAVRETQRSYFVSALKFLREEIRTMGMRLEKFPKAKAAPNLYLWLKFQPKFYEAYEAAEMTFQTFGASEAEIAVRFELLYKAERAVRDALDVYHRIRNAGGVPLATSLFPNLKEPEVAEVELILTLLARLSPPITTLEALARLSDWEMEDAKIPAAVVRRIRELMLPAGNYGYVWIFRPVLALPKVVVTAAPSANGDNPGASQQPVTAPQMVSAPAVLESAAPEPELVTVAQVSVDQHDSEKEEGKPAAKATKKPTAAKGNKGK